MNLPLACLFLLFSFMLSGHKFHAQIKLMCVIIICIKVQGEDGKES